MPNILLDKLPQDYMGYLIRTDFGIGIQIALCAEEPELDEYEKAATALNLLYGRGMPDFETAMAGLNWFMSCGKERKNDEQDNTPALNFDVDDSALFSAFRRVYGIDLTKERLHWFQFMAMMQDIDGSSIASIMECRTKDLSKMKGEERAAWAKLKKRFALPNTYTEDEQGAINDFLAQLNQTSEIEP